MKTYLLLIVSALMLSCNDVRAEQNDITLSGYVHKAPASVRNISQKRFAKAMLSKSISTFDRLNSGTVIETLSIREQFAKELIESLGAKNRLVAENICDSIQSPKCHSQRILTTEFASSNDGVMTACPANVK